MEEDLFGLSSNQKSDEKSSKNLSLQTRLRPEIFEEFIGQKHLLHNNSPFLQNLKLKNPASIILWGPPGCGKTTLAEVIAKELSFNYFRFSAVTSSIKEIKNALEYGKKLFKNQSQKTLIFVDEVHRFNKLQQDTFLPFLEEGYCFLIGATTENPYFEVNKSLLSRCKIYKLNPLSADDLKNILYTALNNKEKGLGNLELKINPDAEDFLLNFSQGDARILLNTLEQVSSFAVNENNNLITLQTLEEILQQKHLSYDKSGDNHYDVISAFIKSMRGSDVDAALYWLARMLVAGEDPRFIARRMVICAAEDVGNADPFALLIANAAASAVEFVGMPEARIPLAQTVIYIASSPKSNASYLAINNAYNDVENLPWEQVPIHLRDAGYYGAKLMGHQKDYKYPHNYKEHFIKQEYRPENIKNNIYYEPTEEGKEKEIKERLKKLKDL